MPKYHVGRSVSRKHFPHCNHNLRQLLSRGTLNKAILSRATLSRATLNKATLNRATLNKATLNKATLNPNNSKANFRAWEFVWSMAARVRLTYLQGLRAVVTMAYTSMWEYRNERGCGVG